MMIVVETALRFSEFDRFDALLHVCRGDIALRHLDCGGTVDVSPSPYKKGFLGGFTATGGDAGHHLVCDRCGTTAGPFANQVLSRSLGRFLTDPDFATAPAQHLDDTVRFVPPEWPPRRRKSPDRRRSDSRYAVDRSMEGQRRIDHDRRKDPSGADTP